MWNDIFQDYRVKNYTESVSLNSISADFQRREKVLEDLALFKGALMILFFCHRDWLSDSGTVHAVRQLHVAIASFYNLGKFLVQL